MASSDQIESDAALARRLQEEEFGSPVFFGVPHSPPPRAPARPSSRSAPPPHPFFGPAPPSPHTPPNSAPPRTVPGAPRQTHHHHAHDQRHRAPRQPTPPLPSRQTHPYIQGRPSYSSGDMLEELFRHASEPYPAGVPDALDSLRDFGDFPGRNFVPDHPDRRRRPPASRSRNPAAPSPDMLMEFFGTAFGAPAVPAAGPASDAPARDARNVRSGSFTVGPRGFTRIEFPLRNARHTARSSSDVHPQRSPRRSASSPPHQHPRGVPRYPQPQRYPQPDEVNQHHIFQRGNGNSDPFRDVGEMLNDVFSDMFTAFNRDRMPGAARADAAGFTGVNGGNLMDYLQNLIPGMVGMNGEPQQYEDWLDVIDRMGHANRGASEGEINQLPSEKFDKKMLERVRMKRRKREGKSSRSGSASKSGSSAAGPSNKKNEGDDVEKCAICLGEYEEGEDVKTLPCFHVFHTECVDRWLKVNKICPFCKQSIRPGDASGA